ncbi:hypothetical protein RRG08_051437 [Elysia crispata]|uniref:Laminin G domain-containing protein n=1 Tax=Elysia crispata TaxID=231223 RepID=A0AAE1B3W1_9GAST|nr:hypothetical protein RRG08_051437 [Elysia crispata]
MPLSNMCHTSIRSISQAVTITFFLLISHVPQPTRAGHKLVKLCKGSQIQIMSRRGVKIEPYERSRVELMLGDYTRFAHRNKLKVHFEFKTRSANGTLFYGFSGPKAKHVIALTLRNGYPRYSIRCPSAHADVLAPTRNNQPINDNKWHTVEFDTRYGHHGVVSIDGVRLRKSYTVSCTNITTLVMGGHNPDKSHHQYAPDVSLRQRFEGNQRILAWYKRHRWLAAPYGHFEGCIRKLNLHHLLRVPPKYYAVSEC